MHKLIVFGIWTLICSGAMAASPLGMVWKVVGKACNSQSQAIAGNEKFQFNNGMFAHIYLLSEDKNQVCNRADAYDRVIQSESDSSELYSETSSLIPELQRTVCREKETGSVISDSTVAFSSSIQTLSISLKGNQGNATLTGSSLCASGALHFDLQPN